MMTQEKALGRYTILRELGRGAIGAVYAARDGSTGAVVALKVLNPALFTEPNPKLAELFLENARSAARLRHRNIVRVFDSGEAGGAAYVAMELVEGQSVRQLLDAGPLSIARAIQAFDDIASALAYAHEEKMVHRGVKPTNILVSAPGVAKIGDFGTGQIGEAALRYMSPEQVRRDAVDHRSDLFSLGAVLYEMLTCRSPFEGKSPEQIRQNILLAKPPPPSTVNPYVSGALDALVLEMLARDPDKRPANARSVLRDLQRLEEGFGLRPAASAATAEPRAAAPVRMPEPEPALRTEPAPPQLPIEREPRLRESEPRLRMPPGDALFAPEVPFMKDPEPRPQAPRGSGSSMLAALALMVGLLSIGLTVALYYSPETIDRLIAASGMQPPATAVTPKAAAVPTPAAAPTPVAAPTTRVAEPPPPPPAPVNETMKEAPATIASAPQAVPPVPLPAQPSPPEKTESPPAAEPKAEKPAIRQTAASPQARVAQPQPAGTAKIIVAVSPQGELYIDGRHYGTTPPITTLDLEPGMHRIEVRSGSRRPYVTYMTVSAGDERRIRHDFAAKPIRPPG
jgi:serine/threonine protein kinase